MTQELQAVLQIIIIKEWVGSIHYFYSFIFDKPDAPANPLTLLEFSN